MNGRKGPLFHRITEFPLRSRADALLCACERGLSLISTLWLLTILSVLATHFLYSIRLEQRAQANFADRTKFHYAAKAGFERSIVLLRGDETPYDSLGENWAEGLEEQIGDGIGTANSLTYRVRITDEGAKVNINTADVSVIQGLLALMGYEDVEMTGQPLAQSIEEGRPYRTVRDLATSRRHDTGSALRATGPRRS